MKKILITGASGFIGYRTANYFQNRGYKVVGWDRSDSKGNFFVQKIDMLNEGSIIDALELIRPDIIIHCAGSADVSKSVRDPGIDFEGNVIITHNLMFAMHKACLEKTRFVFLSSAGVYGNPVRLPIEENMTTNPLSPYAVHKVMCEDLCKYFAANYNMDIKIARIFSAYGEGLRKQIFWDMYMKYKATGKLDLYGTGNESRDYIYIDDVVQAIHLLATTESNDIIFNVANGEEITIKKVSELFAENLGESKDIISFSGIIREGDPINWKADNKKLLQLGYSQTTTIEQGIRAYIDWARKL